MKSPSSSLVPVAVIGRPHGVKGLFKVKLLVGDLDIFQQGVWLQDKAGKPCRLHLLSGGIAKLERKQEGFITSRNDIELLTNQELFVDKSIFPDLEEDEFYFSDLIGLEAFTSDEQKLGKVGRIHDYGAGTSLELTGGELIPFNKVHVPSVMISENRIIIKLPSYIEAKESQDKEELGSEDE